MVDPPGGLHDTAADALNWVKATDERVAKLFGVSRITTVEWVTKTKTGRAIVKAITGS